MLTEVLRSLRAMVFFSVICGGVYPVVVTLLSQAVFSAEANGSLVKNARGDIVGSSLIAQKFEQPKYFWPRPSAADYGTVASGASNLSPTAPALKEAIDKRVAAFGKPIGEIPPDMLMASGSGLDPHISLEAAHFQAERVAQARGLPVQDVKKIIEGLARPLALAFSTDSRLIVNVLELNLVLDEGNTR